jgi:hypothetical protein
MRARTGLLATALLLPLGCLLLVEGDGREVPPAPACSAAPLVAEPVVQQGAAGRLVPERGEVQADDGDVTVHGLVLADAGPVAGARVALERKGVRLAELRTDADGTFHASLPPMPVHPLHVRVTAESFAPAHVVLPPFDLAGQHEVPPVHLAAGAALQGWLQTAGGAPAAGRVMVAGDEDPVEELRADARGRFGGDSLLPGRVRLWISAPGSGITDAGTRILVAGRTCDCGVLRLQVARELEVRCTFEGMPLAGAAVTAEPLGLPGSLARSVLTDAAGRATVAGLPADQSLHLAVAAAGSGGFGTTVDPGEREVAVDLHPLPILRGVVRSAATGAGLPADCFLYLPSATPPPGSDATSLGGLPFARCAADGSFSLTGVTSGGWDLWVRARGHATARVAVCIGTDAEPVQVLLQSGATIAGRVLRPGGAPAEGARIEAWTIGAAATAKATAGEAFLASLGPPPASPNGRLLAMACSDGQGCFCIGDLPAGPCMLVASERGAIARTPLQLASGNRCETQLVLPPPAALQGRVRSPCSTGVVAVLFGNAASTRTARVAADGSFAFANVAPGRYLLRAFAEPIAPELHELQRTLLASQGLPEVDLDVQPGAQLWRELYVTGPTTGTVAGTAAWDGLPAAGCWVRLEPTDGGGGDRRLGVPVAGDGTFAFEAVPAGSYRATLMSPEAARGETAPGEIAVAPGSRLTLSLSGAAH